MTLSFDSLQENGLTPLMLACRDNKFSVVEKLIELGNPVNEVDKVRHLKWGKYFKVDRSDDFLINIFDKYI